MVATIGVQLIQPYGKELHDFPGKVFIGGVFLVGIAVQVPEHGIVHTDFLKQFLKTTKGIKSKQAILIIDGLTGLDLSPPGRKVGMEKPGDPLF